MEAAASKTQFFAFSWKRNTRMKQLKMISTCSVKGLNRAEHIDTIVDSLIKCLNDLEDLIGPLHESKVVPIYFHVDETLRILNAKKSNLTNLIINKIEIALIKFQETLKHYPLLPMRELSDEEKAIYFWVAVNHDLILNSKQTNGLLTMNLFSAVSVYQAESDQFRQITLDDKIVSLIADKNQYFGYVSLNH